MATGNPTRSPKSISDWDLRDIWAYNIKIVRQNTLEFFGVSDSELPPPRVHDEVLTVKCQGAAQHDDAYLLLSTRTNLHHCGSSRTVEFTTELFRVLGYVGRAEGRFTRTRIDLPLRVREHEMVVNVDVCIVDDNNQIVLLAQDYKTDDEEEIGDVPEVRLIAGAIAAFGINNNLSIRTLSSRQDAPVEKVIAGITMRYEMPVFYKIPVTAGLVEAVSLGTFPQQETIVHTYTPRFGYERDFCDLNCRRVVLSCCEAFKKFL